MTDDRSLERAARAWLELGPSRAPDQAVETALRRIASTSQERAWPMPWRWPVRGRVVPVTAAILAVVVLVLGGTLLLQWRPAPGPISQPTPSPSPSASPAASASPSGPVVPPLSQESRSRLYGYTVWYPQGWRVTPAAEPWLLGTTVSWGAPTVDDLHGSDVRLSVASRQLDPGETAAQRLQSMVEASPICDAKRPSLDTVSVGGETGTVAVNGCSTRTGFNGGISPQGYVYAVVLVYQDRAYEFILDGNVDPYYLEEILATVTLEPWLAVDPSPSP